MAEDALYHVWFMHQADDFHLIAAAATTKRVHFAGFFNQLSPGS
jgi:hypothetical protein